MTSPGCTDGNPFLLSIFCSLMVILKVEILRVFLRPAERDAVKSPRVAAQTVDDSFFGPIIVRLSLLPFNRTCRPRQCVCKRRTPMPIALAAYAVLTLTFG